MSLSVADVRRAILGGDVSSLTDIASEAFGRPLIGSLSTLGGPFPLPDALSHLEDSASAFSSVVRSWVEGRSAVSPSREEANVTLLGVAPYGRNVGSYVERVIAEVKPGVIAIDAAPVVEFGGAMMYAFSMFNALGLPLTLEVRDKRNGYEPVKHIFNPGNYLEAAAVFAWPRRVPLVPVGVPRKQTRWTTRHLYEDYLDTAIFEGNVQRAYDVFDEAVEKGGLTKGQAAADRLGESLARFPQGYGGEGMIRDSCYVASRIAEVASLAQRTNGAKVLALVDLKLYWHIRYALDLILGGTLEEVYYHPKAEVPLSALQAHVVYTPDLLEQAKRYGPESTLAQRLFEERLQEVVRRWEDEEVPSPAVNTVVADVVSRTRAHAGVQRPAGVRASLAMTDVIRGFETLSGKADWRAIQKTALLTLPPRMVMKGGSKVSAREVVEDAVKEVTYGIRFADATSKASSNEDEVSSREEQKKAIRALAELSDKLDPREAKKGRVPSDARMADEAAQHPDLKEAMEKLSRGQRNQQDALREFYDKLEQDDLLERKSEDDYYLTKKALELLREELEERLLKGEITEEEYQEQMARLQGMSASLSQGRQEMSQREMAQTIYEFWDAQDRQWAKELTFERMHVYYHIKSTCERQELNQPKKNYYGLKVLIKDMEEQGLLEKSSAGKGFSLTREALALMLDTLLPWSRGGARSRNRMAYGRKRANDFKVDIRPFQMGDFSRDLSMRHTVREIVRQKKTVYEVTRRDFRVYVKRPRLQTDVVLCLDSSGSMGWGSKLLLARIVSGGLARAAVENNDKVGIVTFDDFGRAIMPLTEAVEPIMDYIARLNAGRNTNIGDGIRCAVQLLLREPSWNHKHIILITDGLPSAITDEAMEGLKLEENTKNPGAGYAMLETRRASAKGVQVSAVHIAGGSPEGEDLTRGIAKAGRGSFNRISSLEDLLAMVRRRSRVSS